MGIDIYLSINNNEEVIHIPVTPPKISITSSQGTETFETAGYGLVRIIGSRDLRGISWQSFFPVHDYPFLRDASMKGQEYADKINNWRDRKLPIRLVITSSGFANLDVNIACAISQFNGEVGSNGDFNYSIQIDEVDLLNYTLNNEEVLTVEQYNELIARLEAIDERLTAIENVMIYNYMDENMPEWAKPAIQKLMDKGYLNGTGEGLALNMEMIRLLVINDNAGVYDETMIYNYMDENMPDWAKPTIQKLMDKGYLSGTDGECLELTMPMIRLLVINDNAGLYD